MPGGDPLGERLRQILNGIALVQVAKSGRKSQWAVPYSTNCMTLGAVRLREGLSALSPALLGQGWLRHKTKEGGKVDDVPPRDRSEII